MRAARVTRTDGPQAVEIQEIPDPVPNEGQVLIGVAAAGVNFPDLLLTQGRYQSRPALPFTLGGELAGTVLSAPEASGFAPGDRVAASTGTGAFAEQAVVEAHRVYPLPDHVGFAAGACLPMNYLTMGFALGLRGQLQQGETVLVHGAAGGIGTATIQLAAAMGAVVVSVVSTEEKADFVRALGSHEAVLLDGFRGAVAELTGDRGVDMVVDPVGGDRFTDSLRCLAPLGRLLVLGFTAGDIPSVKVNRLLLNNIDVRGVGWGAYVDQHEGTRQAEWDRLLPLLSSRQIDPPISAVHPLEAVPDAVALLGERGVLGKVVVAPGGDPALIP